MKPTHTKSWARNFLMLDLTLGPSFKVKQWFTGFGELSFRWIQICIGLRCVGLVVIAPGWPGMPLFWDLVQLSSEIPLQLPVSRTLLKQSHNYVFHSNPQHLNLHPWCLGVDSSKNKASLCRWQRQLLPLINKDHLQVKVYPI